MHAISFVHNPELSPHTVSDLRESIGWARLDTDLPDELTGFWATIAGFDENKNLLAWCALLSDGRYHGILLDVMVHPDWQKQGIGRALVAEAIAYLRLHGVRTIHVDFLPERAAFYEKCGFSIGLGGIYSLEKQL